MDNRKLWALLLVPLFMLVFAPMPAHATVGNTYYMRVECFSFTGEVATGQITFLGHTASATCSGSLDPAYVHFPSNQMGVYHVSANAGGATHTAFGWFGPHSCYADGVQYSPTGNSGVYWRIWTSFCD